MTLCEHGCGTELRDGSNDYGEWLEVAKSLGWTHTHTPERCQAATRALLDEAREAKEHVITRANDYLTRAEAAEKRVVEAERERRLAEDELHGEVIAHAAHHTSENDCSDKSPCFHCQRRNAATLAKLVEAERERDEAIKRRDYWSSNHADAARLLVAENARAERFRAALVCVTERTSLFHARRVANGALAAGSAPEVGKKPSV